jgi:hypothetical protein
LALLKCVPRFLLFYNSRGVFQHNAALDEFFCHVGACLMDIVLLLIKTRISLLKCCLLVAFIQLMPGACQVSYLLCLNNLCIFCASPSVNIHCELCNCGVVLFLTSYTELDDCILRNMSLSAIKSYVI